MTKKGRPASVVKQWAREKGGGGVGREKAGGGLMIHTQQEVAGTSQSQQGSIWERLGPFWGCRCCKSAEHSTNWRATATAWRCLPVQLALRVCLTSCWNKEIFRFPTTAKRTECVPADALLSPCSTWAELTETTGTVTPMAVSTVLDTVLPL